MNKFGNIITDFKIPPHPKTITHMDGDLVSIEPLIADKFAVDLYDAYSLDGDDVSRWDYLFYGPFDNYEEFYKWLKSVESGTDPVYFVIINKKTGKSCRSY